MNDPNALWEDLVPYQLNLMLNSNQGLVSFRQLDHSVSFSLIQILTDSRLKFGQT